jgi:tripartite-type tricarboxylate transporter receptor subunit TctC
VRALAVTTRRRVETMPDIPTMHEAGISNYEASAWIAIVAPAKTPAPIVTRLNGAFYDILLSAEARAYFGRLGWQPRHSTPQVLGDYIKSEIARWGKVMQAAGAEGVE